MKKLIKCPNCNHDIFLEEVLIPDIFEIYDMTCLSCGQRITKDNTIINNS